MSDYKRLKGVGSVVGAATGTGRGAPKMDSHAVRGNQEGRGTPVGDSGRGAPKMGSHAVRGNQENRETPVGDSGRGAPKMDSHAARGNQEGRGTPVGDSGRGAPGMDSHAVRGNQGIVQVVGTLDTKAMAQAIAAAFADDPGVRVDTQPDGLPAPHLAVALVFLLGDPTATTPRLLDYAEQARTSRFPLLPIVPRQGFGFAALPEELGFLRRLNAVPWDYATARGAAPGERAVLAIRQLLGLEALKRDMKLFISYKREDGAIVARRVYDWFKGLDYAVFLDTEDGNIDFGEDFQARIHQAIPDKDLLLLIDSPLAPDSDWVRDEVQTALYNRVSIIALRLPGCRGFPTLRDTAYQEWDQNKAEASLVALQRLVESVLAQRGSFDRRARRIVAAARDAYGLRMDEREQRRLLLHSPDQRRCLLDYEDAGYDLQRLYRLHQGVSTQPRPVQTALLVHNGQPLSAREREMVAWAAGDEPQQVLALDQLFPALAEFAAEQS